MPAFINDKFSSAAFGGFKVETNAQREIRQKWDELCENFAEVAELLGSNELAFAAYCGMAATLNPSKDGTPQKGLMSYDVAVKSKIVKE